MEQHRANNPLVRINDRYTEGDYTGQIIDIKKQKFTLVGVIARKGSTVGNTDIDNSVFIPYTTAQAYILGTKADH